MTSALHHHFPDITNPNARCVRCNLKLEFLTTDPVDGIFPSCARDRVEATADVIGAFYSRGVKAAAEFYDEDVKIDPSVVLAITANLAARIAVDGNMDRVEFVQLMMQAYDGMKEP